MTKPDKKEEEKSLSEDKSKVQPTEKESIPIKEETVEDKLKVTEEKLLRTLADMERVFLNHQVLVKGSLKQPEKNSGDSPKEAPKTIQFPKIKLIFIDQLTFYD